MGQAMLADYAFRLDPEDISWTFTVKTKVLYTVGGKVVQVFGTNLGPMTLAGSFGKGGFDAQEAFLKKMTALAKAQGEGDIAPHRFVFPPRGWDFKVFIRDVSSPDSQMSMHVSPDIVNPRWSLRLQIVEENAGLKQVATDHYIARLSEGIGWTPSEFNGPADIASAQAAASQPTVSNVQAGTAMGPPTNPATQGGGT